LIRVNGGLEIDSPRIILRVIATVAVAFACALAGPLTTRAWSTPLDAGDTPDSQSDVAPPASRASTEPPTIEALLRLADQERRNRDSEAEFRYLAQVIERDAVHSYAHARLAKLTGPAPVTPIASPDDLVLRALQHPYDPHALVVAAGVLDAGGRRDQAIEYLERAVWLADIDPSAALTAIRQLYALSDRWRPIRIVPVQLYVDETIRAQSDWQFQMRNLWLSVSGMLDSVFETRFIPIAMNTFSTDHLKNDLDVIHDEFLSETRPPAEGILALITGRELPASDAVRKKGVAEFIGRGLSVRVSPGEIESRVLAHEILHLYGAIHVLDDADSLMNPTGDSLLLDKPNARIARLMRGREFGPGGIEGNVLPWIDIAATVAAYRTALSENLNLRDAGIREARRSKRASSEHVAYRVHQATHLDTHLADASRMVAALMLADGQRVEALRLLELSSQLYGTSTPRGRASAEEAARLEAKIESVEAPIVE
jgi:hypothetical protein